MRLTLKIWRQKNRNAPGKFTTYPADFVNPEMSMLECLDVLNEQLIERGEDPVAFEHDCREGYAAGMPDSADNGRSADSVASSRIGHRCNSGANHRRRWPSSSSRKPSANTM